MEKRERREKGEGRINDSQKTKPMDSSLIAGLPIGGSGGGSLCVWVRASPGSETAATRKVYFLEAVFPSSPCRLFGS